MELLNENDFRNVSNGNSTFILHCHIPKSVLKGYVNTRYVYRGYLYRMYRVIVAITFLFFFHLVSRISSSEGRNLNRPSVYRIFF